MAWNSHERKPGDVRVFVPNENYSRVPVDENIAGFLSFMNLRSGGTLWYLEWDPIGGEPYFGLGTDDLDYSQFVGPITMTLSSMSGPGNFAMWQYLPFGEPVVGWNSTDGLDNNDAIAFGSPTHAHYN